MILQTTDKSQNINNNNISENLQNFQPKPDFVEKNLLIPIITEQMETIALLFSEMKEEYINNYKIQKEKHAQEYKKDFESTMKDYYRRTFKIIKVLT